MWPLLSLRWCLLLIMRWPHNNNAFFLKVTRSPASRNQYIVLLLCPCCHGCRLPCMWPLLSLRWCLLLIMRWPHNNNAVFFKVNYSRFSLRSPVSRNQHIVLLLCPCCHGCRLPCMWPLLSLRWCLLLIMRWPHSNNAVFLKSIIQDWVYVRLIAKLLY